MSARSHRLLIPVKGADTGLIPGQDPFGTTPRDNGHVHTPTTKGTIMNNNAKVNQNHGGRRLVGLMAAGITATIVLANRHGRREGRTSKRSKGSSRPPSKTTTPWVLVRLTPQRAGSSTKTAHLEQQTPDASKVWIEPGIEYTGPRTADAAEHWSSALRGD